MLQPIPFPPLPQPILSPVAFHTHTHTNTPAPPPSLPAPPLPLPVPPAPPPPPADECGEELLTAGGVSDVTPPVVLLLGGPRPDPCTLPVGHDLALALLCCGNTAGPTLPLSLCVTLMEHRITSANEML